MILAGVLILAVLLACIYQALGSYLDDRRFPAPGKMIAIPGGSIHLQQQGSGPTVIFESGLAASSLSWVLVQSKVSSFARACSYDRAGLGWSSFGNSVRTLDQMLSELSALLREASLPKPYILVGHSFGGLLVRAFAYQHPQDVAGIVLVDPVSLAAWSNCSPDELARLKFGARLSRRGAFLARFGIVRAALTLLVYGGRRIPAAIGRISAGQGSGVMERLAGEVAKLPRETHPIVRAFWSRPRSFQALARYLNCLPASAAQARDMSPPPQIPVIILSAASATANEISERESWIAGRPASRHTQVPETTHWLQLDRPDLLVDAIRTLVEQSVI